MQHKLKMTTDIPASITTPDSVETRLGTLRFFDGFPDEATVQTVYDNLDFQRAVEVFLTAMPAASMSAIRTGTRAFCPDNTTVLIADTLLDSRSLVLTANSETVYVINWLDTHDGPLVIDVPPRMLGMIDDSWSRYVTDLGATGPDRGKGGKYLLLPPGYAGDVPDGYFVVRPRTYGHVMFCRGFMEHGDPRPTAQSMRAGFRIYPLAAAEDPPAMEFVEMSGAPLAAVFASDASFFQQVADVVRDEPLDAVDPETRGLLASIGIRKDAPFAPDARMQAILTEAAAVGNATARALAFSTRNREAYAYPGSAWKEPWIGNDYNFSPGGILDLDARTTFFYPVFGITPAATVKMVGLSSQYVLCERDGAGTYLDGGRSYRLHLPPNVPAKDFWSATVYDPQTRSMLQTDQRFSAIGSQRPGITSNPDTSVDAYFGPEPPPEGEANWVQTIPGKGWFVMLRLYGPLEPWFDKTWRPGEIELVATNKPQEGLR
jgi:hypothetical protein